MMANRDHQSVFEQGVKYWNKWRKENFDLEPDLTSIEAQDTDYRGINLYRANLSGVRFNNIDLSKGNFAKAKLSNAELCATKLNGADLSLADLSQADLKKAELKGVHIWGTNLKKANLSDADLSEAFLYYTVLIESILSNVKLLSAQLVKVNLTNANLCESDLSNAGLIEVDLSNAILSGTELTGGRLYKVNLTEANLKEAKLSDLDLRDCILNGIILTGAKLSRVDLRNTKLIGADLSKADLSQAIFDKTDLTDANLSGTSIDEEVISQLNSRTIIGVEVGVNGIWTEKHNSAALIQLIPPGNSMRGDNPEAVIESLKRARRVHGFSLTLAGFLLLFILLNIPEIEFPNIKGLKLNLVKFGLLAMPITLGSLSVMRFFFEDALENARYLKDRKAVVKVGNFPWIMSKYAREGILDSIQSIVMRFILAFHPLLYLHFYGRLDFLGWLDLEFLNDSFAPLITWRMLCSLMIFITLMSALLVYSGWIFRISQKFQKPILFDSVADQAQTDNMEMIVCAIEKHFKALESQTIETRKLIEIIKPKKTARN